MGKWSWFQIVLALSVVIVVTFFQLEECMTQAVFCQPFGSLTCVLEF